jgi:hypothetical protein
MKECTLGWVLVLSALAVLLGLLNYAGLLGMVLQVLGSAVGTVCIILALIYGSVLIMGGGRK